LIDAFGAIQKVCPVVGGRLGWEDGICGGNMGYGVRAEGAMCDVYENGKNDGYVQRSHLP
jgi:hypothetical protein